MSNSGQPSRRETLRRIGVGAGVVASGSRLAGAASGSRLAGATSDLIRVNVGYTTRAGERRAKQAADELVREFAFDALTARMSPAAIDALARDPNVRYVERDGRMVSFAQTVPKGIKQICADDTIAAGFTGRGADVAILDTGIESEHEDLETNVGQGRAFVSCQSGCAAPWDDDNGHGTHVAGVVGAVDNTNGVVGVAPEVTLHSVKVLGENGGGTYSDIAYGIEYTANQGWDVANMSFGGGQSSVVGQACDYAAQQGVLLVAAVGGNGPCTNCVAYPAAYDECVAVGAVDHNGTLLSSSATGPEVELVAPGEDVLSSYVGNQYRRITGTSPACPHVSGVGAALMATGLTARETRRRMRETARDLGLSSDEQGAGLVCACCAFGV